MTRKRRLASHDDCGQRGVTLAQMLVLLQSVHSRHSDVRDDAAIRNGGQDLQEGLG